MSLQKLYRLNADLVTSLLPRGSWPTFRNHKSCMIEWRRSGIKSSTYQLIRDGGAATQKDLLDLIRIHQRRTHEGFAEKIDGYLRGKGHDPSQITLSQVFDVLTHLYDPFDYFVAGGGILRKWALTAWLKPHKTVSGITDQSYLLQIPKWFRIHTGRALSSNHALQPERAIEEFKKEWGDSDPNFEEVISMLAEKSPWSVVLTGQYSRKNEQFQIMGGNVVVPLTEGAYRDISTGQREFNDIRASDIQIPAHGVYLYGAVESPDVDFGISTRRGLVALMWQIAALTSETNRIALAPAPHKTGETRLVRTGFKRVGTCVSGRHTIGLYEKKSRIHEDVILAAMRRALINFGHFDRPPIQ
jgi:hypothetical protein